MPILVENVCSLFVHGKRPRTGIHNLARSGASDRPAAVALAPSAPAGGSWGPSVAPPAETCDGIDDDCDDEVDGGENACGGVCELDNAPGAACGGADSDLCEDDAYECTSLSTTACSLGPLPSVSVQFLQRT